MNGFFHNLPNIYQLKQTALNSQSTGGENFTKQDFLEIFPQFTEKLNSVSDTLVNMWIDRAKEIISPSDFGSMWKYVISLFVAHNIVKYLEKINPNKDVVKNAQTKGFQTSKSADGLSVSYDIGSALADYNNWGTLKETEYGRELIDQLKSLKAGVFYIS